MTPCIYRGARWVQKGRELAHCQAPGALHRPSPGQAQAHRHGRKGDAQQGFQGHAHLRITTIWGQGQGESYFHPGMRLTQQTAVAGQVTLSSIQDLRPVKRTGQSHGLIENLCSLSLEFKVGLASMPEYLLAVHFKCSKVTLDFSYKANSGRSLVLKSLFLFS